MPDLTPFTGRSAQYGNIWDVLQTLIDRHSPQHRVFLNGDWNFINPVLGLKAPGGSKYPCFRCLVEKGNLPLRAVDRTYVSPIQTLWRRI